MKSCDTPPATDDGVLHDAPMLEFPDWSGMVAHRSHMTFEQAVRWNEEMLAMFPPRKKLAKLEAANRCNVEFIL